MKAKRTSSAPNLPNSSAFLKENKAPSPIAQDSPENQNSTEQPNQKMPIDYSFDYDGENFTMQLNGEDLIGCQWLPPSRNP